MTQNLATNSATRAVPDDQEGPLRDADLRAGRGRAVAPVLWEAWTAPAARAVWAAPSPSVTVEFLEADTRVGGREVSLCKVEGQPDIRCEGGWLALQPALRSVNYEVISSEGVTQSAALVTADISGTRRAQPAGRDGAAFLAGGGHGGGLPARLRRGTGQSRGRG